MEDQGAGLRHRVGVLDDDPWRRRGVAEALRDAGGVIDVMGHGEVGACSASRSWLHEVDVLLVGLDGQTDSFDRFAPLLEAERVAALARVEGVGPLLVVGLSTARDHPLLPLRASEAGVDHLYWWDRVTDIAALEELVLTPTLASRPTSMLNLGVLRQAGLTTGSTLNAGLRWIEASGFRDEFVGTDATRLSRRQRITVREKLSALMRATSADCGSAAAHDRLLPSWLQLRALVDLARGASDSLPPRL